MNTYISCEVCRRFKLVGDATHVCYTPWSPTHEPCDASDCQECCAHDEFDHDVCMDCGYERDPGDAIDRAYDRMRDGDL